jgi:hypothetical protein
VSKYSGTAAMTVPSEMPSLDTDRRYALSFTRPLPEVMPAMTVLRATRAPWSAAVSAQMTTTKVAKLCTPM